MDERKLGWDKIPGVDSCSKGKSSFTEVPVYSINVTMYFKDVKSAKRIFYEAEADFGRPPAS